MALVALLVLAAAVLAVVLADAGSVNSGQLAGISIIWLVIPLIVAGFFFLLFTVLMIYVLARALRIVPVYTHLFQVYAAIFNLRVTDFMDRLVEPVIRRRSRKAGWQALWRRRRKG